MSCRYLRLLLIPALLLSALPSLAQWTIETVPDTLPDYGFYRGAAFDSNGNLFVAYSAVTSTKRNAPSVVRLISRAANGTWSASQTIDSLGATGISLAIDGNGNPAITESQSSVHFVYQNPTTHAWNTETVEKAGINDVTSLAFDPSNGQATVTYRNCNSSGAGSKFARRKGANSWTVQVFDSTCGARYSSLVYDKQGIPGIAYSYTCAGSTTLNCLKYAHWDPVAAKWGTSVLEQGVSGYGTFASLAFDSLNNPAITHGNTGVRYVHFNGSTWSPAVVLNDASGYEGYAELNLDAQDNALVALNDDSNVIYATQAGNWAQTVVATGHFGWTTTLRTPGGVPYILYYDSIQKKLYLAHQ